MRSQSLVDVPCPICINSLRRNGTGKSEDWAGTLAQVRLVAPLQGQALLWVGWLEVPLEEEEDLAPDSTNHAPEIRFTWPENR